MSRINMVVGPKPHVHSVWLYWGVFFTLVFLTVATVVAAQFDFGSLNVIVAVSIAVTKALLVMGVFMHLLFDSKFFAVIAATSLVFLSLLVLFPIYDLKTRGDIDPMQENFRPRDEAVYKHASENPEALPLRPGLQEAQQEDLIFIGPGEH